MVEKLRLTLTWWLLYAADWMRPKNHVRFQSNPGPKWVFYVPSEDIPKSQYEGMPDLTGIRWND